MEYYNGDYYTITLCGSSKFKKEFISIAEILTRNGFLVQTLTLFGHVDAVEIMNTELKQVLDEVHKQKIYMSDGILILDVNGYIGESTASAIEYAKTLQPNPQIWYLKDLEALLKSGYGIVKKED